LRQKSLDFDCHSGLDPESSISDLDSRFRGNDDLGTNVKKRWTHYTGYAVGRPMKRLSAAGYPASVHKQSMAGNEVRRRAGKVDNSANKVLRGGQPTQRDTAKDSL